MNSPISAAPAVEALLRDQFGRRDFTYVTPIRGDDGLWADSHDMVVLAVRLEREFRISIDDDEMERVETVGDVVALVNRKLGRAAA